MRKITLLFFLLVFVYGASAQSVTEVTYPRYVQGVGSGSPSNDAKVPYACRMTVGGLIPAATYRYYSRFVDNPSSFSNGIGTYILVNQTGNFTRVTLPSLTAAGSYGEFTTNASGSYTGWFVIEPGSDIGFSPGSQLYWRIILNDGAGGNAVATRVTATNPVTVINWGTTAADGSAIHNVASAALTAKNFIMLYDNFAGTGRPVSGTFIESDGTTNTTTEFYNYFYETFVDGQDKIWGTIIPNNLSNGINNISQYALSDGNFINKCTSPNGVYGTTDTRNATAGGDPFGDPPLVINCTPSAGCNITLTTALTHVQCFGGSTGAINLSVSGAVAPIIYSWSNGGVTEDLIAVPAGVYTVTVTDASSCTATATVAITQPSQLVASETHTSIACGGTSTVTISATGGTAPYTGTGVFTQPAGTLSYTVTDANGCTSSVSVTVTVSSGLIANESHTAIACFGGTSSVTITATGGTAPYSGTGIFTQSAGTQSYTVTDANGCTSSISVTVTQPAQLVAAETHTQVVCFGGSSTVTIGATGGTTPYTGTGTFTQSTGTQSYNITDANGCTSSVTVTVSQPSLLIASETHSVISCFGGSSTVTISATGGTAPYSGTGTFNQSAGAQSYTVTDASGCTSSVTVNVSQPTQLTATETHTAILCGGNSTVTISATGGTPPYTGTGNFTQPGGTQSYTVTDANGCTSTVLVTVTAPSGLVVTETHTPVVCFGGNSTVTISVTGGNPPYTGTGVFTQSAGTQSYSVTDANGCTNSVIVTIIQPTELSVSETHTAITCTGNSSTVTISATGGTSPYTGTGTFTQPAGTQTYTVTDAKGCTSSVQVTVATPSGILLSESHTAITCFGGNSIVTINASGGTAPYTGTGVFTQAAGTQTYSVSDANGCTNLITVSITQPTQLVAAESHTAITCLGNNSTVTISATGGTTPYTGTGTFTQQAGTQLYAVTDANGCTSSVSVTVTNPAAVVINESHTAIACFGGNSTVTISAIGGTTPYTGTGNFTQPAGTQSYTVTDANGCSSVISVTVTEPTRLVASETHTAIPCFGGTANVTISATGGTPPYTGTGTFIQALSTHSYTVTDSKGCTSIVTATLPQPAASLVASATIGTILYHGGTTRLNVTATGGTPPYTGTGMFIVHAGPYSYTVTDSNGCTSVTTGVVSQPEAPTELVLTINPNPGFGYFNITVSSNDNDPVTLRIADAAGRVLMIRSNVTMNIPLRCGDQWPAGIYFAEALQGDQRKTVKLIKVN